MSILTMDMTSYEVQSENIESTEYSDEVLCSGWVPTLAEQQAPNFENSASMPESLANVDAEHFLDKMYVWLR